MFLLTLFRCPHPEESLSRVFTLRVPGSSCRHSYRVCLECGSEIGYDLEAMRPTGAIVNAKPRHPDYVHIARSTKRAFPEFAIAPERKITR